MNKEYKCEVCDTSYALKEVRDRHYKSKKHIIKSNGLKINYCEQCNHEFCDRSSFTKHMANVHKEDISKYTNRGFYLIDQDNVAPPTKKKLLLKSLSNKSSSINHLANDEWYSVPIEASVIDNFIMAELSLSNETFETNKIKYITEWIELDDKFINAMWECKSWVEFLDEIKDTLICIDAPLYSKIYDNINNTKYVHLIPLFKKIKLWLKSSKAKNWNNQLISKLLASMDKF